MADGKLRIPENDLERLAVKALSTFGLSEDDAGKACSILVLADLFGVNTHGVSRILAYGERLEIGGINPRADVRVEKIAPTLIKVDGDNGVGPLVGRHALDAAMAAAAETGMAVAFVRGSNHFGPVGPYCYLAAQQGFASIIGSNATTTITPWGGREARLGNNPVGFGVPRPSGDPIILDMAISVAARAKIRNAKEAGEPIPAGWATDASGRPTTDPAEALKGFLLPIGGHKGYGLALMVDLFAGVLSGAAYLNHVSSWVDSPEKPQDLGHFFLLIDAKRLSAASDHDARMTDFAEILHATPATDPARPVLLPGEIEMQRMAEQRAEGILLPAALVAKLRARAEKETL